MSHKQKNGVPDMPRPLPPPPPPKSADQLRGQIAARKIAALRAANEMLSEELRQRDNQEEIIQGLRVQLATLGDELGRMMKANESWASPGSPANAQKDPGPFRVSPKAALVEWRQYDHDGNLLTEAAWIKNGVGEVRVRDGGDMEHLREHAEGLEWTISAKVIEFDLYKACAEKELRELRDKHCQYANNLAEKDRRIGELVDRVKAAETVIQKKCRQIEEARKEFQKLLDMLAKYTPPKLVIFGKRIF